MAKNADLPGDYILSAEFSQRYKPDPEIYLSAAQLLGLAPEQVMMVAAHNSDLIAVKRVGFGTAFIYRTSEYGPKQTTDLEPDTPVDIRANDFMALASCLT